MFKKASSEAVKKYALSRSAVSQKITPAQVWAIWTDVNNWPTWDKGLEYCKLEGEFKQGATFSLKPMGAPMELKTTLIEVEPNSHFKDTTSLPLGTVEVTHKVEKTDDGVKVTHTIEAEIFEEKVPAFEGTLWAKWQTGLPNSVQNIVTLAEEQNEEKASFGL